MFRNRLRGLPAPEDVSAPLGVAVEIPPQRDIESSPLSDPAAATNPALDANPAPAATLAPTAPATDLAETEPLLFGQGNAGRDREPETEPVPVRLRVELMGTHLRAGGTVDLGHHRRLSDYVNHLDGFFSIHEVVLLSRLGATTRIALPDLRVRLDEIGLVGQREAQAVPTSLDHYVPKQPRRLVVMTAAHIIYGNAYLHEEASLTMFIDATDPRFLPMTNVRVRWLADRRLAGRYPFALLQRSHIIGVATEVSSGLGLLRGRARRQASAGWEAVTETEATPETA